jgi:hypothetical protein
VAVVVLAPGMQEVPEVQVVAELVKMVDLETPLEQLI